MLRIKRLCLRTLQISTIDFHFAKFTDGHCRISIRVRWILSVVVVDDVSPMVTASNIYRIRYCSSGIFCILKA